MGRVIPYAGRAASLIAAIAILSGQALGQPVGGGLDSSKSITQYVPKTWGIADGLPQNTVYDIAQTADGYLWLATGEGLARFDGRRFVVYDPQTTADFQVSEVNSLAVDSSGILWIGTRGGGVLRFDGTNFKPYLDGEYVTSVSVDRGGAVWIGTYSSGAARIDGDKLERYGQDEGLHAEVVSAIYSSTHSLLAATDQGVYTVLGSDMRVHEDPLLATSFVSALLEDDAGALWIGLKNGTVVRRAGGRDETILPASDDARHPTGFLQDASGTIWIGTKGSGVVRYRDGRIDRYTEADGLPNNDVLSLFEDREKNLWVGTQGGGLLRLRDGKFTMFTEKEGLGHNNAFTAFESRGGTIWFGHDGGASALNGKQLRDMSDHLGLTGTDVLAIGGDRHGSVYFGTFGRGIVQLEKDGTTTTLTTNDGLASNAVFAVYGDSRGRVWFGTDHGVSVYDGFAFKSISSAQGLSSEFITAIAEDSDGVIYVGTYDGGVNVIRQDSIQVLTTEDGLAGEAVLSLYIDEDDIVWVGTWGAGLTRIKDGSMESYSASDGLHNNNVFVILEDELDRLWMTSNKGISRIEKSEFDILDETPGHTLDVSVFGVEDGLWTVESNGGQQPAGWKSADGRLWFPTVAGVASIDPVRIPQNPFVPPVVIESLVVDNKEDVETAGPIELAAGSDKIEITYTALSLVEPDQVRFRYRLDGADEDWYDAHDRRLAFYTNLDPGEYTFQVIASNNDGLWNETGASLTLYLKPFFYQTAWFRSFCAAAVLILLFLGHRWRVAQLRARERFLENVVEERTHDLRLEKEKVEESNRVISAQAEKLKELDRFKTRFFANISHEFRTPLTMIVGPLENALHGAYGNLNKSLSENVQKMLRNGHRLLRLINQLLDLSKLESGKMQLRARPRNVSQFLEGVLYTFTAFADQKDITLTFESEQPDVELYFEPDKFEKIFFNLLSNAAKFTPDGGEISVKVRRMESGKSPDGDVEVRVRDTGRGIPPADLPHIFDRFHQVDGSNTREHEGTGIGLALVSELTLLHGGTITAESEIGKGTEFVLVFPTGSKHLAADQVAHADGPDDREDQHESMVELAAATLDHLGSNDEAHDHKWSAPPNDTANAPLILVAEDNRDVREYIVDILRTRFRVMQAEDGQAALEQAQEMLPSLIVSDVMMPRMDGNDLCRAVKADPGLNHVPVVLLTARATHESRMEGLAAGADDYLSKPFNATELLARVDNLLKLREQERELKEFNSELSSKVDEQVKMIMLQRESYEKELITERDRAQESARLKSSILNNLSHELRTPITSIVGYAQLLRLEMTSEKQRGFVDTIVEGGVRLSDTLDAVLTLSELDARSKEMGDDRRPLDICLIASEVAASYTERAESHGLTFRTEIPSDPLIVYVDSRAIARVLRTVLDNAVKFTDRGGTVLIGVTTDGESVSIAVTDTGVGIDEQFFPQLFDAFTQESKGLARSHEGLGLGLSIASRLMQLQGGEIDVLSKKGVGSTFTLRVPCGAGVDPTEDSAESDRGPMPRAAGGGHGRKHPRTEDVDAKEK